jgi:hypothetical protein
MEVFMNVHEPPKKTRLLEIPDGNHAYLEEWKARWANNLKRLHPEEPDAVPLLQDSERDPVPIAYYDD